MKFYFGKYPHRATCSIYTDYMNKKYGFNWKGNQTEKERWIEILEDSIQWVYNHTINLYLDRKVQKIKVRIDPWDTWSMDHTLSQICVPMLKQLKETKHGAPCVDDEDVPAELMAKYAEEKPKDGTDSNWFKRWDWVMDEMIFAFESIDSNWEDQFWVTDPDEKFGVRCPDWEARQAYQDRIQNGFRLFGKYFQSLWD